MNASSNDYAARAAEDRYLDDVGWRGGLYGDLYGDEFDDESEDWDDDDEDEE